MKKKKINILGTEYCVEELSKEQDNALRECDGYCDKTTHRIVVCSKESDCDLGDFQAYQKKVLRHKIIHAFHFESGIAENFENKHYGFSETLVDWFAIQSPKIFKVFQELDIL